MPTALSEQTTPAAKRRQQLGCAVIIDAARGTRHLDNSRSVPSSLEAVEPSRTVLDWALHAVSGRLTRPILYVGGYHIQKVMQRYPGLQYRFHAQWQQEGEAAAVTLAQPDDASDSLVVRSRTLFVPEAVERLLASGDAIAAGYYRDGELQRFAGIVWLPARFVQPAFAQARSLAERQREADLEAWVDAARESGLPVSEIDLDGLAAPSTDRRALVRLVFGGKGRALEQVRPLVRSATVLEQVRFSVAEWKRSPDQVLGRLAAAYRGTKVVVRSSAYAEDSLASSAAGRFRTVLSVSAGDRKHLADAIEQVAGSYAADGRAAHLEDEIFVQRHIGDLDAGGVLLTRDLDTNAPYFVVNIDRRSGRSDAVTSGAPVRLEAMFLSRRADPATLPPDVRAALGLARELQEVTHFDALDIEFGVDRSGTSYLFQVRPLAERAKTFELADEDLGEELESIRGFLADRMRPHPFLHGRTTVLGTMPDWNPSEMLGTTPRPLALSLYQRLIGDTVWAQARSRLGYADVVPEPLILSLGGRPYVDVRASLNSFLPAGLEPRAAAAWVENGLQRLSADPSLHDKLEFEIAMTCFTPDAESQRARLREAGLTRAETDRFCARLLALTDGILCGRVAPLSEQREQLRRLEARREQVERSPEGGLASEAASIHLFLADCAQYGTLPFAVLARYAFIAVLFLRSLQRVGVFTPEEVEAILRAIPTVASELARDTARHRAGRLTTEAFLARYGHLRPSSYDITSPNYAAAPSVYLAGAGGSSSAAVETEAREAATELFSARAGSINRLLREHGFACRAAQLRDFILQSIPARERAKFEFMKSLNGALEAIAKLGERLGCSRDDISFLPIERIERGATDSLTGAVQMESRRHIEFFKKRWNLTCAIRLPHLVRSPQDVDAFQLEEWTPNFVSTRRVVAPPVRLQGGLPAEPLEGRIVLIEAADPGYDWMFGHRIAGLVTQYGGIASHMAIRAAEFGLPAAIGCGELIFGRLRGARLIELDCMNRKVNGIP
jgi:hypothetical protein